MRDFDFISRGIPPFVRGVSPWYIPIVVDWPQDFGDLGSDGIEKDFGYLSPHMGKGDTSK